MQRRARTLLLPAERKMRVARAIEAAFRTWSNDPIITQSGVLAAASAAHEVALIVEAFRPRAN